MDITIIGIPFQMDVARWGYASGPAAFLDQGLVPQLEQRGHRVQGPVWIDLPRAARTRDTVTNLGHIARRTAAAVRAALGRADSFVLALEGDCTHALGVIGGLAQAIGTPGIAWFDAHGDLNTRETTTSGYWGGMPYAVALGWDLDDWRLAAGLEPPVRPEAAALIGASDLDPGEIAALERYPILRLDAAAMTGPDVAQRLQAALRPRATAAAAWYVHIDTDVAGPDEAPGGLTPAPHWPPRQRLLDAATTVARSVPIKALALATYNPDGDPTRRGAQFGLDMMRAIIDNLRPSLPS
jgi:arginase